MYSLCIGQFENGAISHNDTMALFLMWDGTARDYVSFIKLLRDTLTIEYLIFWGMGEIGS